MSSETPSIADTLDGQLWYSLVSAGGDLESLLVTDYFMDEKLIDVLYHEGLRRREQGLIQTDDEWRAYINALDYKNRSYL